MSKKKVINNKIKEKFDNICKKIADSLNIDFVESTWENELRGFVITAFIDKQDGINLDDCEMFHRELLKNADDFDYDFLEVSSLGADRPIKNRKDFERFAGSTVELKLFSKQNGKKIYTGIISDYTDEVVKLIINDEEIEFDLKDVALIKPYIDVESEVSSVDFEDEN